MALDHDALRPAASPRDHVARPEGPLPPYMPLRPAKRARSRYGRRGLRFLRAFLNTQQAELQSPLRMIDDRKTANNTFAGSCFNSPPSGFSRHRGPCAGAARCPSGRFPPPSDRIGHGPTWRCTPSSRLWFRICAPRMGKAEYAEFAFEIHLGDQGVAQSHARKTESGYGSRLIIDPIGQG